MIGIGEDGMGEEDVLRHKHKYKRKRKRRRKRERGSGSGNGDVSSALGGWEKVGGQMSTAWIMLSLLRAMGSSR